MSPKRNLSVKPIKPCIIVTEAPKNRAISVRDKENCPFIPGQNKNFQDIQSECNLRRETYAVQNFNISSHSDEFNDSLETPKVDIESKLQSTSFMFSPVATPKTCIGFKPDHCSTDEKSFDSVSRIGTKHVQLFANSGTSPVVSNRRETYLKVNLSSETFVEGNLSSETYVKGDLSSETYIKGNLSSETYVKGNVSSSSTFVTDSPLSDLTNLQNLQFSPLNMQVSPRPPMNMGVPLSCIMEESFSDHLNLCTAKRKSTFTHSTTPLKKPNIEVKNEGACAFSRDTFVVSPRLKRKLNNTDSATPQKRFSDWSVQGSGLRVAKKTTGLSLLKRLDERELKTTNTKEVPISNPFLLATTNSLSTPLCFDEKWMTEQEMNFKKWLNYLLTPPAEFDLKEEKPLETLDIIKQWKQCCLKKEVEAAPSREVVSNEYHTNARLNRLRRNAQVLKRSAEIHGVITKVLGAIDSDKLMIRKDRDLHLDLSLQQEILSILLSYNPLWLRIGLETIYKEIIPMNSNSDLKSLMSFISERFFRNPALLKRYKSVHSPKYCTEIKKFIFKKFLSLVYFLDQAKTRKLIQHDPCLFRKSAPIKESRDAILKFSKESVSSMGDITKFLKYLGYVVHHKQTYIDEFDYAVTSLGVDLRDGVRLTRVMEIILLRNDLSRKLRVPAISRLQKIHNVKLVFDSLNEAGFEIKGDIEPKDIVNGHKEKTLFFLWQIIHKFEAPLMVKSATSIQKWWRSPLIQAKRLKLREIFLKKASAATKIQTWYRHKKLAAEIERFVDLARLYKERRILERNAIKIQSYCRMYLARKKYLRSVNCIKGIQRVARQWLENGNQEKRHLAATKIQSCVRMFIVRRRYQKLKHTVLRLQTIYRANRLTKLARSEFLELKAAAIFVQKRFRANRLCRETRNNFVELKASTILLQQRFRANRLCKHARNEFLELKAATIFIQRRFRANKLCQRVCYEFLELKAATIFIQQRLIANRLCRIAQTQFIELKASTILIQRRFRANKLCKKARIEFENLKAATISVQRRFRANRLCRNVRDEFLEFKATVIFVQQRFRANRLCREARNQFLTLKTSVISMQRLFRANKLCKDSRTRFLELKTATILLQRRFRANRLCEQTRNEFLELKSATLLIQRRFRAIQLGRKARAEFLELKTATLSIQRRFRANRLGEEVQMEYLRLKKATILMQRRFRANRLRREAQTEFLELKAATLCIQRRFRANRDCRRDRAKFLELKTATVFLQRQFRANTLCRVTRTEFLRLKTATISIQQRFRTNKLCRDHRTRFLELKTAAISIQRRFRANKLCRTARKEFLQLKTSTVCIQQHFRAWKLSRETRFEFLELKTATVTLQRRFRSNRLCKETRMEFLELKRASIYIQQRFRANRLCKMARIEFNKLKTSAICIQRRFRANMLCRDARRRFLDLKAATLCIQRRFRANKDCRRARAEFLELKTATIFVQRQFRANIISRDTRAEFLKLKMATVSIQQHFRANRLCREHRRTFLELKTAAISIQRRFRANKLCRTARNEFLQLKASTVCIQQHFRAWKLSRETRLEFLELKTATVTLQRRFRSNKLCRETRMEFLELKRASICIQQRFRANKLCREGRAEFLELKAAAISIQRRFRANRLCREYNSAFLKLKTATVFIQRRFRANRLCRETRIQFLAIKTATILIQRQFRANRLCSQARKNFLELKKATVIIQRRFRAYIAKETERNRYLELRQAVITVQRRFRANVLMKKQRNWYLQIRNATLVIQRFYHNYCSPEAIQRRKENAAAIKIQALWKGYIARLRQNDAIMKIRARLRKANEEAKPENTLAARRKMACETLLDDNQTVFEILKALEDLEFISRRCQSTCLKLGKPLFIDSLYDTITSTNRSPAQNKVSTLAAQILINLYKYKRTSAKCWIPEHISEILTIMVHCCDKEDKLFPTLCTLLWLFAHNEEYKLVIVNSCNFEQKLIKMQSLCERKKKMVGKTVQKFDSLFKHEQHLPLPSLTPDWGLERMNHPKVFVNSIQAIHCLQTRLRRCH